MSEEVTTEETTTTNTIAVGENEQPEEGVVTEEVSSTNDTIATQTQVEGAPESYEAFTYPEDFNINEEYVESFRELAKSLNLTQEAAQNLIDFNLGSTNLTIETLAQEQDDLVNSWAEASKADREIGGVNFEKNMSVARQPIEKYGTKELKDALNETGIGNHPDFLRFLFRLGNDMQEDKISVGSNPQSDQDIAKILFPSMN
jgi:hypothetical protein